MGILGLGTDELLIILVAVLLLFGATSIPKLARALGRAKGEFKKAQSEFAAEAQRAAGEPATPTAVTPADDQVRASARSLGIDDSGKSVDELKRLIQQRLA